jgi:mRNA-degrading endonuclease toxin of MazEF toxin-antitoxin module
VRRGVPDRGDVLHIDLDPTRGSEQQGRRFVLVLTLADFNRFGLALVAPISQGGGFAKEHGFAVTLEGAGAKTQGVVLCHQVRMIAFRERGARLVEKLPADVIDDVLARVRTLLD